MSNTAAKYNLTEGPIFNKLLKLSLPIMATSLMQTAHSLTNMFWLSWLGEGYVAAAGLVGQFLWISFSIIILFQMGAEIGVSQNMGKGDPGAAKSFAQNGFMLSMLTGGVITALFIIFRVYMLRFFNIESEYVAFIAQKYLEIVALSIPFNFGHFVLTGVYGGFGNTKLPFYINSAALLLNIILAPILIFALDMGISGAALSMVIAAAFNFTLKIWAMTKYKSRPFEKYKVLVKMSWLRIRQILLWGAPISGERIIFTLLFMIVSRLITSFGDSAVASHQVGMQIEALSFMIGSGFSSALTAFIGQNYGAQKWGRIRATLKMSFIFMGIFGVAVTAFLFFLAEPLVSIFLTNPLSIQNAADYLRIIALAQLLFCMEGVASGAFRGRGLTAYPSIAGICANLVRVVLCYALAATALGLTGVWWGIAAAMTVRSVTLLVSHSINMRKLPKEDCAIVPRRREMIETSGKE